VGSRHVLNPLHPHGVVDVAKLVDVLRLGHEGAGEAMGHGAEVVRPHASGKHRGNLAKTFLAFARYHRPRPAKDASPMPDDDQQPRKDRGFKPGINYKQKPGSGRSVVMTPEGIFGRFLLGESRA
jgi:hypothetical protein